MNNRMNAHILTFDIKPEMTQQFERDSKKTMLSKEEWQKHIDQAKAIKKYLVGSKLVAYWEGTNSIALDFDNGQTIHIKVNSLDDVSIDDDRNR